MAVAKSKAWDGFDTFKGWEAACLIAGVEVSKSVSETNAFVNKLLKEMEAAYDRARAELFVMASTPSRPASAKFVPSTSGLLSVQLADAIEWCKDGGGDDAVKWTTLERSNFEYQDLSKAMLDQWLKLRGIASEYRFVAQGEEVEPRGDSSKPLSTRERNTFLRIIIGLAIDGYGYVPGAARSGTAKEISDYLFAVGVGVGEDTIRHILQDAARDVLPANFGNSGDKPN